MKTLLLVLLLASCASTPTDPKDMKRHQLQSIDSQIAHFDMLIDGAQARKSSGADANSIDAEIYNYKMQLNNLKSQRQAIEVQH